MTPEERLAQLEAKLGIATVGTQRSAYALGIAYEVYCRDRDVEDDFGIDRSFRPLREGTYVHEQRILRGLAREGVQTEPPALDSFLSYVRAHPKGEAGLDNQRRAFARLMEYHGQPVPRKLKRRWDTKDRIAEAKRGGVPLRERERFFRDPVGDVVKLLHASPWRRPTLNQTFRHAVLLSCMTGPRGGEARALRVSNVDAQGRGIKDWWQQKKSYGRVVIIPETWVYAQPTGPTVENYLKHVRPKAAALAPKVSSGDYFLNGNGLPFASDAAWRGFLGDGIKKTLGYSIGPHAFRRWCATMRRAYGWQVPEIAALLDDTDEIVKGSYIDHRFINARGIKPRRGDEKPALPPIWRLEEFF